LLADTDVSTGSSQMKISADRSIDVFDEHMVLVTERVISVGPLRFHFHDASAACGDHDAAHEPQEVNGIELRAAVFDGARHCRRFARFKGLYGEAVDATKRPQSGRAPTPPIGAVGTSGAVGNTELQPSVSVVIRVMSKHQRVIAASWPRIEHRRTG
jgi:hypothetical protein